MSEGWSVLAHEYSNADGYYKQLFSDEAVACPVLRIVGRVAIETFAAHELLAEIAVLADRAQTIPLTEDIDRKQKAIVVDWHVRTYGPAICTHGRTPSLAKSLSSLPSFVEDFGIAADAFNKIQGKWKRDFYEPWKALGGWLTDEVSIGRVVGLVARDRNFAYLLVNLLERLCGVEQSEVTSDGAP